MMKHLFIITALCMVIHADGMDYARHTEIIKEIKEDKKEKCTISNISIVKKLIFLKKFPLQRAM